MRPIPDTALVMVVKDEVPHLERLLPYLRPWFEEVMVGVQDSSDGTAGLVERYADRMVLDRARGYGDATLPAVQGLVRSTWAFRVDADEWPQRQLLGSLRSAATYCATHGLDGLWIPFRSWIDGVEWRQPHRHLRFWANRITWPPTLHSRPMTERTEPWPQGYIEHRKTLDEHVQGYLGYYAVGINDFGWTSHNREMLYHAIEGAANRHGWEYVTSRPWWPEASAIVYAGRPPSGSVPQP